MKGFNAFIGLDVHKDSISVAVAESGRAGEIRMYGTIANSPTAVAKLIRKLVRRHETIEVVYEAGPCGYSIFRQLSEMNIVCRIVAPSHTPKRPGDRVKNDTKDAMMLARLFRAGELTFVWVPDVVHEAMRDLVRARQTSSEDVRKARALISMYLLKRGCRYEKGKPWTLKFRLWLTSLKFEPVATKYALQSYINRLKQAEGRRVEIDQQIADLIPEWDLAPVATAVQVFKGISQTTAVTLAAEIGDFSRFSSPRQLMSYLGLVPSEYSSGGKQRPGAITKAGNKIARAMLVEAAWGYRWPPKVGQILLQKRMNYSQPLKDTAWKAQVRLNKRFRQLEKRGKRNTVAATAVAREFVGFIWYVAIGAMSMKT